ncbi:MAG: DNA internalization-related competence protein ComEC/Rec2 [Nitrosomonas sp.]|nr:DNA internalization-related competence protein ComEC/Rec2 [Nitrosomonas sp.]
MYWSAGLLLLGLPAGMLTLRISGRMQWAGRLLILVIIFGAGFFWAALWASIRLADSLPPTWEGQDIKVIGVITEMPQPGSRSIRFRFRVEQILTPAAIVPDHLLLSWYKNDQQTALAPPDIAAGERWQLVVRLKRPHGNLNPHVADYSAKLFERNIRATGYVRVADANQRIEVLVNDPRYFFERKRAEIRDSMQVFLKEHAYTGPLIALAVGDQRAIPSVQWDTFTRTGTNHLMAISGLHITLVSGLIFSLVYWLWRRYSSLALWLPASKIAILAGLAAALVYALLSGFAIPARRAFLMLVIMSVALWQDRRVSMLTVLGWVLLVVTIWDPWAVITPGFWLSFAAVGLIGLTVSGRIGQSGVVVSWIRIQWAITLGLLPLLLFLFGQVSLVSPIANALAIPWMTFAIVPFALLALIPGLEFLLSVAHAAMQVLMIVLQWLAEMPLAVWQQPAPDFWAVVTAIIGMIWLLLPGGPGLGVISGFPARWLGILAVLPLFLNSIDRPAEGEIWLTVLDVGQGLAVMARTRQHNLLFDAGPGYGETDSGKQIIVPYLRAEGITALDRIIVSHADSDHSGGALSVLTSLPTQSLLGSLEASHPVKQAIADHQHCRAGDDWWWDGIHFAILHPDQNKTSNNKRNRNESSCVLKITTRHGSVLLPADIGQTSEQELLHRARDALPATVLIAPHHGSKSSSSAAFIRQVNPKYVIFTVGYRNSFNHPHPEIVDRYRKHGTRLLRSDHDGAIMLRLTRHGMAIDTARKLRHRFWHDGAHTPVAAD